MKRRVKRIPRKALQAVYDMACEMSHSNGYAEVDDDNNYLGVDPEVIEHLASVKRHFRLRGAP